MRISIAIAWLVAGCSGASGLSGMRPTGDPCASNGDCASGLCLPDPFPGGYCASDCSSLPCGGDDVCKKVSGVTACLKACAQATDCRSGYVCFQGVCQLPCSSDAMCGKGFGCNTGACLPLPGKPIGAACANDTVCSSRTCDPNSGTCQQSCASDAGCPGGTCYVNPISKLNNGSTDGILPICVKHRGGLPSGAPCKNDLACDAGQCELGVCVALCEGAGNCAAMPPMSCVDLFAQVDIGAPRMKGCLMKSGTLTYNLGSGGGGPVGMPSNALAFNIFVEAQADNTAFYAGVSDLSDPANRSIYASPASQADYYNNPIRYAPSLGTSMMLVSNAPNRVTVGGGLYSFSTFAASMSGVSPFSARVRMKLGAESPTAGSIPLHVFITNLAGGCSNFDAASAPGRLSSFEAKFKALYAQAGLTVGPIVYADSASASSITVNNGPSPELDVLLKGSTLGDQGDALELTIIKHIYSSNPNFEVLGIAGGIPGSTGISGTPHSGAAVSLTTLCNENTGDYFAATVAHELGHTLGLFHSLEQDMKTQDPLSDTKASPQTNLMYWEETAGKNISPEQSQVILGNPAVQ